MSTFKLQTEFAPAGDQVGAIAKLVEGLENGEAWQTLLGVTGSGKTFTMANIIMQTGRPAIVMAQTRHSRRSYILNSGIFFLKIQLNTLYHITIITSLKPMCRHPTRLSRRMQRSMIK